MSTHSTSPDQRLAFLFDIDGTLLTTDGAARESFIHAVRHVLRIEDDLRDIAFAGRTEPWILADILAKHGRSFEESEEGWFWNSVFDHMRQIFGPHRGRLMPGVSELLDLVEREPAWVSGLLTGNMTQMAQIKLERFGIGARFQLGAFGEEAADRNHLARLAVRRVDERFGIPPQRCIVIGDTAHDVECARAAGAHAVVVGTGPLRREEIAALDPDLALEDLSDTARLVGWARRLAVQ